ncbi:hypothetical protein Pcinc_038034 [Petrolisthes cinctipes]|uniref:Uncharacterized protein n=1 Tax=Petrolisthes cinctipes TaxID=88211 RepID=A0AAE1BRG7_PETCI|nr:hypothetical protein Pcinc_038034 [Petrolisthes cinctipes]
MHPHSCPNTSLHFPSIPTTHHPNSFINAHLPLTSSSSSSWPEQTPAGREYQGAWRQRVPAGSGIKACDRPRRLSPSLALLIVKWREGEEGRTALGGRRIVGTETEWERQGWRGGEKKVGGEREGWRGGEKVGGGREKVGGGREKVGEGKEEVKG